MKINKKDTRDKEVEIELFRRDLISHYENRACKSS